MKWFNTQVIEIREIIVFHEDSLRMIDLFEDYSHEKQLEFHWFVHLNIS